MRVVPAAGAAPAAATCPAAAVSPPDAVCTGDSGAGKETASRTTAPAAPGTVPSSSMPPFGPMAGRASASTRGAEAREASSASARPWPSSAGSCASGTAGKAAARSAARRERRSAARTSSSRAASSRRISITESLRGRLSCGRAAGSKDSGGGRARQTWSQAEHSTSRPAGGIAAPSISYCAPQRGQTSRIASPPFRPSRVVFIAAPTFYQRRHRPPSAPGQGGRT